MQNKNKIRIWALILLVTITIAGGIAIWAGRTSLFKGSTGNVCLTVLQEDQCRAMPACTWTSIPGQEFSEGCYPDNPRDISAQTQMMRTLPNTDNIPVPTIRGNSTLISISWTNGGNATRDREGYWIDIDTDDNINNGAWHKRITQSNATNTTAPEGFEAFNGASGPLTFNPSTTYYFRVFYRHTNEPSPFAPFSPPSQALAPTINASYQGNSAILSINWTNGGVSGRDTQGYWIDIDNDNNWNNGAWHKRIAQGATNTTAPEGFEPFGSTPPLDQLTFTPGATYYIRVFYQNTGEWSQITQPFIIQPPGSGLTVSTPAAAPTGPLAVGQTITFSSTIHNSGNSAASISPTLHSSRQEQEFSPLPHSPPTISVAAGGNATASWQLPPLVASQIGTWDIWVCANETTCSSHLQNVTVNSAPGADDTPDEPPGEDSEPPLAGGDQLSPLTISAPSFSTGEMSYNLVPAWQTSYGTSVFAFGLTNPSSNSALNIGRIKLTKSGNLPNSKLRNIAFFVDTISNNNDFTNINFLAQNPPHSNSLSINSSNAVQWDVSPTFSINPGQIVKIYVLATVASDAPLGNTFRFEITGQNDIAATRTAAAPQAQISGAFPFQSPQFTITGPDTPPPPPQPDPADLMIYSLTNSGTLNAGSTTIFRGTVKNIGTSTSGATQARFCTDNANCMTSGTNQVGNLVQVIPLSPGSMVDVQSNVAWGITAVGTHTVALCVNFASSPQVTEDTTTNNCAIQDFAIITPSADFTTPRSSTPETSTPERSTPNTGNPPQSNITVTRDSNTASGTVNAGTQNQEVAKFNLLNNASTTKTINAITLSINGSANASDIGYVGLYDGTTGSQLGSTINVLTGMSLSFQSLQWQINPGQTKILLVKLNVLSGATANRTFSIGISNAAAIITSDTTIINGNFPITGNTLTITSSFSGTGQQSGNQNRADLVIQSVTISPQTTVSAGAPMNFSTAINNTGTGQSNNFQVRFCVDNANCLNSNAGTVNQDSVQSLAAGGSAVLSSSNWTSTQGNHTVTVCADVTTTNEETNENNNCSSQTFIVNATQIASQNTNPLSNSASGGTTSIASGIAAGTTPTGPTPPSWTDAQQTQTPASGVQQTPSLANTALNMLPANTFGGFGAQNQQQTPSYYRGSGVSPDLAGSQRLIRAPERGRTGPEALVYFGILAAIQAGRMIFRKRKK